MAKALPPEEKRFPYVWVTWVSKLLAGEARCVWSAWYRAHHKYEKRPRADQGFLTEWTARHDAMVAARVRKLRAARFDVTLEKSNEFKLTGKTAILAGKPDIVARVDDATALVIDEKSGRKRDSDLWQVEIYLFACARTTLRDRHLVGEVEYRDSAIVRLDHVIPEHQQRITDVLRTLGARNEPVRTPSVHECGKCDVLRCPDRLEEGRSEGGEASTDDF